MNPRYVVGAAIALLALLAIVVAAGVFLPDNSNGGSALRIESASINLALNDEPAGDFPDAEGATTTCVAAGPQPDTYSVDLQSTVVESGYDGSETAYRLVVHVGERRDAVGGTVPDGGRDELRRLLTVEDDETATAGDAVRVRLELRADGERVDEVTRTATARGMDRRCTGAG